MSLDHNHHHMSLWSQPPPSVTIITTTTICHHHHNHHLLFVCNSCCSISSHYHLKIVGDNTGQPRKKRDLSTPLNVEESKLLKSIQNSMKPIWIKTGRDLAAEFCKRIDQQTEGAEILWLVLNVFQCYFWHLDISKSYINLVYCESPAYMLHNSLEMRLLKPSGKG